MQDIKASCPELVSIVIVNKNRELLLRKCLQSIFKQSYKNYEVIVIDNASTDNSVEMIKNNFPDVKIIVCNKNLFYCEGYNLGISEARGDYILCINNDVILDSNFLLHAIKGFSKHNKVGQVTGKIVNPVTGKIDSTGQFLSLSRRAIERGYRRKAKYNYPEGLVWGCPGSCVLYSRKMLEEIKLKDKEYFDSSYKVYLEDLDLNWRANRLGWKAYYIPEAIAYHYRGMTGWINSHRLGYLNLSSEFKVQFIRNRYATIIKNESWSSYFLHLPFILSYDFYLWFSLCMTSPRYIIKFWEDQYWIRKAIDRRKNIARKIREYKNG